LGRAYRLGATALMDVEFTGHNTDTWGTNWERKIGKKNFH